MKMKERVRAKCTANGVTENIVTLGNLRVGSGDLFLLGNNAIPFPLIFYEAVLDSSTWFTDGC